MYIYHIMIKAVWNTFKETSLNKSYNCDQF